jgi:hypothetical protein
MWPSGLGKGLQNLLDWFDSNGRLSVNKRTHRWQQRKFATAKPNVGDITKLIKFNKGIVITTEAAT